MRVVIEKLFSNFVKIIAICTILILAMIIFFIFRESVAFFKAVPLFDFILGKSWKPISISEAPIFSILPMILATIYTSLIAIMIALPIGVGCAVFLSIYIKESMRNRLKPFIDFLTGIPSVVYGMIGLLILVKYFENFFHMSSGESTLAGGVLLSIMIVPYIISTCDESMIEFKKQYEASSQVLGISKTYMITKLILPGARKSIIAGTVLALARAMGETMAVMMVIGNAPIMPAIFGKAQTIPSLIALEMGGVTVNSLHYHALFAAGFILMLMLLLINAILYFIRKNIEL